MLLAVTPDDTLQENLSKRIHYSALFLMAARICISQIPPFANLSPKLVEHCYVEVERIDI